MKTQVPFANGSSLILVLFEKGPNGQAISINQWWVIRTIQYATLKSRTPSVSSCKQSIACWCTNGRTAMSIRESHSLRCQSVQVGGWNFAAIRIQDAYVAISQVIGQDVDDIWSHGCRRRLTLQISGRESNQQDKSEKWYLHWILHSNWFERKRVRILPEFVASFPFRDNRLRLVNLFRTIFVNIRCRGERP